jgi:hypothetical protein
LNFTIIIIIFLYLKWHNYQIALLESLNLIYILPAINKYFNVYKNVQFTQNLTKIPKIAKMQPMKIKFKRAPLPLLGNKFKFTLMKFNPYKKNKNEVIINPVTNKVYILGGSILSGGRLNII